MRNSGARIAGPDLAGAFKRPRELEVLRLMAAGLSNKEIAGARNAGETTIKSHLSSILSKMGVRDRTRAVLRGLELGYV